MCAEVLCETASGSIEEARGWQRRHLTQVDAELLRWWTRQYPLFPSQCCIILPTNAPEGVRESRALWVSANLSEVRRCEEQANFAVDSYFPSLFAEGDLAVIAYRVLNSSMHCDPHLLKSIKRWAASHSDVVSLAGAEFHARSAEQFLFLYGDQRPSATERTIYSVPSPSRWNVEFSNSALQFSDDNLSVTRPGSISCYPAALAALPAPHAVFNVILVSATPTSNWYGQRNSSNYRLELTSLTRITFGLVRAGFATSSSDGVGRAHNTWGLCDDRSQSCISPCSLISCGTVYEYKISRTQ